MDETIETMTPEDATQWPRERGIHMQLKEDNVEWD